MSLSLLAGMISSLLIQLLTKTSAPKNNYNQSFSTPPQPNNYRSFPSEDDFYTPSVSPSVREKVTPQENTFASPSRNKPTNRNITRDQEQFDQEDVIVNKNSFDDINNSPLPKEVIEVEKTTVDSPEIEPENPRQTIRDSQFSSPEEKPPVDNNPAPSLLKSREPSLYSYQSKEKTEFKQPYVPSSSVQHEEQRQQKPVRKKNSVIPKDNIYDAPFRVIPSASPEKSSPRNDYDEDWDDEDWDF